MTVNMQQIPASPHPHSTTPIVITPPAFMTLVYCCVPGLRDATVN